MRWSVLLLVLALAMASCAEPGSAPRARGGAAEKPATTTTAETSATTEPVVPIPSGPLSLPDQVSLTLLDLDAYWSEELPATFGVAYEPVSVLGGYDVATDGPPACGERFLDAEIALGNAFYCGEDDTIAWDEVVLFPTLYDDYGPFAVSLVLAHEWGHAVQARVLDEGLPTIISELQADCLAGAWAGRSLDDGLVEVGTRELDVATAGFLYFRDPVGTSAYDPRAHGNAFDRVGAFTEGLRGGAEACASYPEEEPEITQLPFLTESDAASGGNLPKSEVFPTLARTLEVWWADLAAAYGRTWEPFADVVLVDGSGAAPCSLVDDASLAFGFGYCADENVLVLDVDGVVDPLYDVFGDFGPALVMGNVWAEKGQAVLGLPTTGAAADLQLDCLAGAWADDGRLVFDEEGRVVEGGLPTGEVDEEGEPNSIYLSPGDLDEAIQAILYLGEATETGLSAFERVEAFRTGVLDGAAACLSA